MVVAIHPESTEDLETQLLWPLRLAAVRGREAILWIPVAEYSGETRTVPLEQPSEEDAALVASVRAALDALLGSDGWRERVEPPEPSGDTPAPPAEQPAEQEEDPRIAVGLRKISASRRGAALAQEVRAVKPEAFAVVQSRVEGLDAESSKLRRDTLAHFLGLMVYVRPGTTPARGAGVLVPLARGPHCRAAVTLAKELAAGSELPLTSLYVEPDIGADAKAVGAKISSSILSRAIGDQAQEVQRRVVIDRQPHAGIQQALETGEYDLVVLGTSKLGALGRRLVKSVAVKLTKATDEPTVMVVRAATPLKNRALRRLEDFMHRAVPQLARDDRVALVERVQSSSLWDFDFVTLMSLSTLIAAMGLVQDSAAVIIGAMLVAPLMTPLLGIGLALVQRNNNLMRMAFRSVSLGFVVSFVLGLLVGLLKPDFVRPSMEMYARDWPELFDLFVAFVSGLAAAYASSRPNLLAALPGVAIAAALVPPIATSGLAAALGHWTLSFGAALLFFTNMVAIVLASSLSMWAVGLRYAKESTRLIRFMWGSILFATVALAVGLSIVRVEQDPDLDVSGTLIESLHEVLDADRFRLRGVAVDRLRDPVHVTIEIGGAAAPDRDLVQRLQEHAEAFLGQPTRVRVEAMLELVAD